jgi:hypothetical protein
VVGSGYNQTNGTVVSELPGAIANAVGVIVAGRDVTLSSVQAASANPNSHIAAAAAEGVLIVEAGRDIKVSGELPAKPRQRQPPVHREQLEFLQRLPYYAGGRSVTNVTRGPGGGRPGGMFLARITD